MILLPKQYNHLNTEAEPRQIREAIKIYGTHEIQGSKSNPEILKWAKECGLEKIYTNDDTAWCGLFMAVTLLRSGYIPLQGYDALRAKEWAKFGIQKDIAELGDILVFDRSGGGHVGYYVGEDEMAYHLLGGNQGNTVCIVRRLKERCMAIRSVPYNKKPNNIRVIYINANGEVSKNEG